MELSQRIDQARVLIAERDAIDVQLAELFATPAGPLPLTILDRQAEKQALPSVVRITKAEKKKGKKGQKVCKKCGTPGHMAKTCPQGAESFVIPEQDQRVNPAQAKTPVMLSETEFTRVQNHKGMFQFSSAKYGMVNKLSPLEVSRAARVTTYEEYVNVQRP